MGHPSNERRKAYGNELGNLHREDADNSYGNEDIEFAWSPFPQQAVEYPCCRTLESTQAIMKRGDMDTTVVFLQSISNQAQPTTELILDLLGGLMPWVISLFSLWYMPWHARKLKDRELADSEENRKFQLEKVISEKAVTVMTKSYHFVHRSNRGLTFYGKADESMKEKILEDVWSAREYWEENLFYLPKAIRSKVIPMTNFIDASFGPWGQQVTPQAFVKISEMFSSLEDAFASLMEEYNLFDKLGSVS